jgi:hypothetical protein
VAGVDDVELAVGQPSWRNSALPTERSSDSERGVAAADPPERPLELSDAAAFGGDDWAGYAANDSSHLAAATRQAGHG